MNASAGVDPSRLHRMSLGTRLTLCFALIIVVMLSGNGLLLWQFHQMRAQADRLNGVDQELIAVLRFQAGLRSFQNQLNELAQSNGTSQLLQQSEALHSALLEDAQRTQAAFDALPASVAPDPKVLATLEAIQSSLPSHVDAIRALATSGDWAALRVRLTKQVQPLEFLSTELVKDVDREVVEERAKTASNIVHAEHRMYLIVLATGIVTLLIATALGVIVTRSITEPLKGLVEGSKALARGEFQHRIAIKGEDELAHLGKVFNETAGRLRELYENLRNREEQLRRNVERR